MNKILISFFLLILPLSSTNAEYRNPNAGVGILVFGDFGTGSIEQHNVAQKMISYCSTNKCDFALTTGDNVYKKGIENAPDGTPKYGVIMERFVNLYKALKIPIYLTLGNHDINIKGGQGGILTGINNAVNFSANKLNPVLSNSSRKSFRLYNLDASFYAKTEIANVYLYAIDTNNFPSSSYKNGEPDKSNSFQLEWLKGQLKQQNKRGWTIVFGHMPLLSHGVHGHTDADEIREFRNGLLETLCNNQVDFYLSGHDHHLEINKFECETNKHVLVSIISGAAGIPDKIIPAPITQNDQNLLWINGEYYEKNRAFIEAPPKNGFVYLELMNDTTAHIKLIQLGQPLIQPGNFIYHKGKNILKNET